MRGVRDVCGAEHSCCWFEISIISYRVILAREDGAELQVVENRESAAAHVAPESAAARLRVLLVIPVVLGDGGAPETDCGEVRADGGEAPQPIWLVARNRGPLRVGGKATAIEHSGKRLGMGKSVVDARQVAVHSVVGTAVEKARLGITVIR